MKKKITSKERKKMMIWAIMVVLGTMFATSIKEIFLDPILNGTSSNIILLISIAGLVGLYYWADLE